MKIIHDKFYDSRPKQFGIWPRILEPKYDFTRTDRRKYEWTDGQIDIVISI